MRPTLAWRRVVARSIFLTSLALIPGCARTQKKAPVPVAPAAPPLRVQQERFDLEINTFVNLDKDSPARPALEASLHAQIATAIREALQRKELSTANHALRTLGLMYTPAQLDAPIPSPTLAPAVMELYQVAAKQGDEQTAVLAFAVLAVIGDQTQQQALIAQWPDLASWLNIIPDHHDRPAFASPLRLVLQTCLAYWPSPWVATLLDASYQEAIDELVAKRKAAKSPQDKAAVSESMGQIYYWMIRVALRRADLKGALALVQSIKTQEPSVYPQFSAFDALFARALDPKLAPSAGLELLEKLDPRTLDAPDWLMHDSWSTVRAIASQLIYDQGHKSPHAHAHLARALRGQALTLASVPHYQRALTSIDDKELWTELAYAHSESLDTQARYDLKQARAHLGEIEAFYQKADARFGKGRLTPGINDARMRLVHALFDAGDIDQSAKLSEQSLATTARPDALRMLSTIAMHRANFQRAQALSEQLAQITYQNPMEQQRWSVVANLLDATRARLQQDADSIKAKAHRASLVLNKLLDLPGLAAALRGELFMQRFEARMLSEDFQGADADLQNALRSTPNEASVYLRAMSEFWLAKRLQDAHHLFERATAPGAIDPVESVYVALWYLDLARAAKDAKAELDARTYLSQSFVDPWTSNLAQFALGNISATALQERAKNKTQRIEALFYQGLALRQQGDLTGAAQAFDQVRRSEMMGLVEYKMASLAKS